MYVLHIVAGAAALAGGYFALFTRKGAEVHRRSGTVFVYSMLAMCVAGMLIAVIRDVQAATNVPAAVLTGALVLSGVTALRVPTAATRRVDAVAFVMSLGVGIASSTFGVQALANGGTRNGMPAVAFFLFGCVGLLAAVGDARRWRGGPLSGSKRIARHLWRMTWALFVAAMSFFIGQAKVFPAFLRVTPLLAVPVVVVLGTLGYWMWRVRARQMLRGLVVSEPAARAR
jgi:uncharacterized membrane protein